MKWDEWIGTPALHYHLRYFVQISKLKYRARQPVPAIPRRQSSSDQGARRQVLQDGPRGDGRCNWAFRGAVRI